MSAAWRLPKGARWTLPWKLVRFHESGLKEWRRPFRTADGVLDVRVVLTPAPRRRPR